MINNNTKVWIFILLSSVALLIAGYQVADRLGLLIGFLLAVFIGRLRFLAASCPFRLSWWAVSFPLAGAAVCALRYAGHTSNLFTHSVAIVLLAGVTLLLFAMTVRTLVGAARGELKALVG